MTLAVALRLSPHRKYEHQGGPGRRQLFGLLQGSARSDIGMDTLMASQLLFWLLRAPEGHAKSIGLRRYAREINL